MTESEQQSLYVVTLGALLHDIGKFMQRAEVPLSPASRQMENTICKLYQGRYSHQHVLWTSEFFDLFAGHPLLSQTRDADSIAALASYHHNPATPLQELIQLADCLSSGSDRMADEESHGRDAYKKERLHAIFEHLSISPGNSPKPLHRYEMDPLDPLAENLFPTSLGNLSPSDGSLLVRNYANLWKEFLAETKEVMTDRPDRFVAPMMSLLEKYTWCIPSSTMDRPDISLYDHARTTAAIAAALYRYRLEKGMGGARLTVDSNEEAFLLLVGDVSGIQNYIYNIKGVGVGGTAKRLRARSFSVSVLADLAAHKILRAFGLPLTNLVMGSGGKFYLLLPALADAGTTIDGLDAEMNGWLLNHLNGELGLNMAAVTFSCREFKEFNSVLRRANTALQRSKGRPFQGVLAGPEGWDETRFVHQHVRFTDEERICQACGKFPGVKQSGDDAVMCPYCFNDKELGRKLTSAQAVTYHTGRKGEFQFFDGYSFSVHDRPPAETEDTFLTLLLNDWSHAGKPGPIRSRYLASHIPRFTDDLCGGCDARECREQENAQVGQPMFFTCLAQKSQGRKALGVLKADVDNLGLIFINGFKSDRERSISRIAALSRMLDGFFSGRIDALLREEFAEVYTVYAGGDDLLLLGPWDRVLEFARKLREEFRQYTCGNPDFTLSAGITLAKPRLPLYAIVESAEALLDDAKKKAPESNVKPKNQLVVLGDRFTWDKAEHLHAEGERLSGWLAAGTGRMSMGTVRQLLDSARQYRAYRTTGDTRSLRFVPMLSYAISRNINPNEAGVVAWLQDLTDLKSQNLNHLSYIANYAIMKNRR